MTLHLNCVLILCLFGFPFAFANEPHSCHFNFINGVIKEQLSPKNSKAHSLLHCLFWSCNGNKDCIGSYNKNTDACKTAIFKSAQLALSENAFDNINDKDWVSFTPTFLQLSLPTPVGLSMMDSLLRGKNLGSKGKLLDMSNTGLAWSSKGPLGSKSDLKYAQLININARPHILVLHNGRYLLDLTKPFTLSLWMKSDPGSFHAPIIEGWNTDTKKYAFHVWLVSSLSDNRFHFQISSKRIWARSTVYGYKKAAWRHLAAIYKGPGKFSLYLNATALPITKLKTSVWKSTPNVINIGHRGSRIFKGSMACISIFERALTQEEVRTLMQICP